MHQRRRYRRRRYRLVGALSLPSMLTSAAADGMHMHCTYTCGVCVYCMLHAHVHVIGYMPKLQRLRRCEGGGGDDDCGGAAAVQQLLLLLLLYLLQLLLLLLLLLTAPVVPYLQYRKPKFLSHNHA